MTIQVLNNCLGKSHEPPHGIKTVSLQSNVFLKLSPDWQLRHFHPINPLLKISGGFSTDSRIKSKFLSLIFRALSSLAPADPANLIYYQFILQLNWSPHCLPNYSTFVHVGPSFRMHSISSQPIQILPISQHSAQIPFFLKPSQPSSRLKSFFPLNSEGTLFASVASNLIENEASFLIAKYLRT